MDIHSRAEPPASLLSNFAPRAFRFDGVECAGMEGLLQGMKFEDPQEQAACCALHGPAAKKAGLERSEAWTSKQTLWWKGRSFARESWEHARLVREAYQAMAGQCPDFREALLATGEEPLTHSIGGSDPRATVLTEAELCSALTELRTALRTAADPCLAQP